MNGHRATRSIHALVLLLSFVVGGVLAPTVHRVQHGTLADRPASQQSQAACDHARHGVAVEVVPPELHDDPCVLCARHYLSLAAPAEHPAVRDLEAPHVQHADGLLLSIHVVHSTIRAPPFSA